jgi:alkane 1-monooxygenase
LQTSQAGLADRARKGKPALCIHNDVINAWAMTAALWGGLLAVFGFSILPWLLIPCFLVPLLAATHLAIFYKLLRRGAVSSRPAFQ